MAIEGYIINSTTTPKTIQVNDFEGLNAAIVPGLESKVLKTEFLMLMDLSRQFPTATLEELFDVLRQQLGYVITDVTAN